VNTAESPVEHLVASARKRSITNLIAEQAAAGLCAALAGFLILLLAGSDALAWPWLIVLFGGGAAWSAWRTWQGLPSLYEVAQRIDRRLNLSDTLSTAIAFATKPEQASETAWHLQRASAEAASSGVTPAQAAPYQMPRQAKWLAGLLAATVILLGIRLGVLGTLDLSHPLVAGLSEYLPAKVAEVAADGFAKSKPGPGDNPEKPGEENQDKPQDDKKDNEQAGVPQPDQQPQMGDNADQQPQFGDDQQNPEDMPQNAQNNDGQQKSDQQREGKPSDNQAAKNENESDSNQQQASNKQPNEQQSLLDKVRDSLSNLMNKMQQQQKGNQNGQKQNQQNQQQQGAQKDQQQANQQGQGQQQSEQSADKQQGASQKDAEAKPDQNSSSESNQKSASKDPKTGHGTQDGKKEIQQAQQQAEAMGKISEIIGQRSKTVQGEIMLDRKASQQHELKTAYAEKDAFHREAGSDLRRDEIPVDLQHYVQQYFTKIRQTPAPPAK